MNATLITALALLLGAAKPTATGLSHTRWNQGVADTFNITGSQLGGVTRVTLSETKAPIRWDPVQILSVSKDGTRLRIRSTPRHKGPSEEAPYEELRAPVPGSVGVALDSPSGGSTLGPIVVSYGNATFTAVITVDVTEYDPAAAISSCVAQYTAQQQSCQQQCAADGLPFSADNAQLDCQDALHDNGNGTFTISISQNVSC